MYVFGGHNYEGVFVEEQKVAGHDLSTQYNYLADMWVYKLQNIPSKSGPCSDCGDPEQPKCSNSSSFATILPVQVLLDPEERRVNEEYLQATRARYGVL